MSWYKGRSLFDIRLSFVELLVQIIMLEGVRRWCHEAVDDVNGNRKYDGGVVLCRDAVQCLEVAQLKIFQIEIKIFFCFIKLKLCHKLLVAFFPVIINT